MTQKIHTPRPSSTIHGDDRSQPRSSYDAAASMRLTCLPVSLYADLAAGRRSLRDWFEFAASLQLDGADVSVSHLTGLGSIELDAIRRQAADAGIELAIVATYSDFIHPDAVERGRRLDDARCWIDRAARLGAHAVRLTAGEHRADVAEADGVRWAAEGLAAAAEAAHASGLGALYENHVRGAHWTEHDFTQPAARFIEVVRLTRGSHLEVLFDTANSLALDEDPAFVLDHVIDRVGAVHVSDIRRRGSFEPTTIGTGVSPIRELLRPLAAAGFDGWVSVEEASRTGDDGFRRAVAYADDVWVRAGGQPRERRPKPGPSISPRR
jgi:sugar phosphate isomerase/epimerase